MALRDLGRRAQAGWGGARGRDTSQAKQGKMAGRTAGRCGAAAVLDGTTGGLATSWPWARWSQIAHRWSDDDSGPAGWTPSPRTASVDRAATRCAPPRQQMQAGAEKGHSPVLGGQDQDQEWAGQASGHEAIRPPGECDNRLSSRPGGILSSVIIPDCRCARRFSKR